MSERSTSEVKEFARRGEEIYERDVLPRLLPEDDWKVVAIEIETGDYEIGKDEIAAAHCLRARHLEDVPDPETCRGPREGRRTSFRTWHVSTAFAER